MKVELTRPQIDALVAACEFIFAGDDLSDGGGWTRSEIDTLRRAEDRLLERRARTRR